MPDHAWKQLERTVARVLGGQRHWANSGDRIDVTAPGYLAQVKLVKSLSLAALTALAEEMERAAAVVDKGGLVVVKLRRGRGRASPALYVVTEATWIRLNGTAAEGEGTP